MVSKKACRYVTSHILLTVLILKQKDGQSGTDQHKVLTCSLAVTLQHYFFIRRGVSSYQYFPSKRHAIYSQL